MLFNSGLFLFIFFPAFIAAYFLAPSSVRNAILVIASLLFYSWAEPIFVIWAIGSALLDYGLGILITRSRNAVHKKLYVAVGVSANLALLIWFKYAMFTVGILSHLLRATSFPHTFQLQTILLPIGISFIVFEKITYLVDLYRATGKAAPNLMVYLLYVFYFPKLLAGPIIRYCDIEEQLVSRKITFDDFRIGICRLMIGLAKKVLIADQIAGISDKVFSLPQDKLGFFVAWVGVVCFTLQIYFDFSGYSDMAIGISRILGFRLRENFNNPYLSENFTDFWRRWHISLSTWIREYLYIPLGGNRVSTVRTYLNLCTCFLLCGLWHGAAWTFVIWGAFHGLMLIAERAFLLRLQSSWSAFARCTLTLILIMLSWVIFRSDTAGRIVIFYKALFDPFAIRNANYIWVSPDIAFSLVVGGILVFGPAIGPWRLLNLRFSNWRHFGAAQLGFCYVALLLVIGRMSISSFRNFIYFRF